MVDIVPAILTDSNEEVLRKLRLLQGVVDSAQIDVDDGVYAKPATWPYAYIPGERSILSERDIAKVFEAAGNIRIEVDLMVAHPEEAIDMWINAGASRIVLHAESMSHARNFLHDVRRKHSLKKGFAPEVCSIGIALKPSTDIAILAPYISECDYIQCMGIDHIGRQGEPFDPRVLLKIRALRQLYPEVPIQVDGGVSLETATKLSLEGASRLVVGSAFWSSPNLEETITKFTAVV